MLSVSKYLKNWNMGEEFISVVLLSDGTKWVRWVWHDGGEEFEEYLKVETAAQELEEYYKHDDLAVLIRGYQARET